jgi:hypothetical protein
MKNGKLLLLTEGKIEKHFRFEILEVRFKKKSSCIFKFTCRANIKS